MDIRRISELNLSDKLSDPILSWAVLLHDIGKPKCFELRRDKNGEVKETFYGHEFVSSKMAREILTRFEIPNIDDICWLIENHMRMHNFMKMRRFKQEILINNPNWERLLLLTKLDELGRIPSSDHKFNEMMDYLNKNFETREK